MALIAEDGQRISPTTYARNQSSANKPTEEKLKSWEDAYRFADAGSLGAPKEAAQASADEAARAADTRPVVGLRSSGADITDIQFKLDALGFDLGPADGQFGRKTEAAVRAFQESQGITVDGVVGPETRQALDRQQNPWEAIDSGSLTPISYGSAKETPPAADVSNTDRPEGGVITEVEQQIRSGNVEQALGTALNSEGDKIEVDLEASANVKLKYEVGFDAELGAQIERTANGYSITIDERLAGEIGLGLDRQSKGSGSGAGVDASATIGLGGEAVQVYEYDTLEGATRGLENLIFSVGNHPHAELAAGAVENATDVVDRSANIAVDVGRFVPDALLPPGAGLIADHFGDEITGATGALENGGDRLRDRVERAKEELNAASAGGSYTLTVDGNISGKTNAELGLPTGVDLGKLELKGNVTNQTRFTVNYDNEGGFSLEVSQRGSASASGGVKANGQSAGGEAEIHNSITQTLSFKRDDEGRLVTDGSGEITFNIGGSGGVNSQVGHRTATASGGADLTYTVQANDLNGHLGDAARQLLSGDTDQALGTLASTPGELEVQLDGSGTAGLTFGHEVDGVGEANFSGAIGRGTEATFTVDAQNGLNGDLAAAARQIVDGDARGAAETIVNIEGDLVIQNRNTGSASVEIKDDVPGADINLSGSVTVTDQGEAAEFKNVSIRSAFEAAQDEATDFAEGFSPEAIRTSNG